MCYCLDHETGNAGPRLTPAAYAVAAAGLHCKQQLLLLSTSRPCILLVRLQRVSVPKIKILMSGTHLSMMSCALACSSGRDITPCRADTCKHTNRAVNTPAPVSKAAADAKSVPLLAAVDVPVDVLMTGPCCHKTHCCIRVVSNSHVKTGPNQTSGRAAS